MNIEENLGILSAFILYLGGMIAIGTYYYRPQKNYHNLY